MKWCMPESTGAQTKAIKIQCKYIITKHKTLTKYPQLSPWYLYTMSTEVTTKDPSLSP